uniref:hypothetical protein n=1 Tax=Alistipes indistinctus TaxID=626932 RepID=UPI003A87C470
MKSKRAKEYIKTIKLNKANVDYCLEHGRVNGFLLIDIENAVELAEQDAEEKIEALKARAVEAYRTHCRRYTNPCIWTTRNKCPDTC